MSNTIEKRTKPHIKVSVVCAWYNRQEFIDDTISSLLNQTLRGIEIIVINDGSSDPEVDNKLRSYKDSRLKIVVQENQGFTKSIAKAVELARAPLIAVHGAGDISHPRRLELQYQFLKQNPCAVGVGCGVGISSRVETCTNTVEVPKELAPLTYSDFVEPKNPFVHGEVMFRKSVYCRVGGYRPAFRFAQDRDLWIRMAETGYFLTTESTLYYRRIIEGISVGSNPKVLLAQKALSEFARQCAQDRKALGFDLVDIFGVDALLYRRRSKRLSTILGKYAMKCLASGDIVAAKVLSRASICEKITGIALVSRMIVVLSDVPLTRWFLRVVVRHSIAVDKKDYSSLSKKL